jgi:phospholipase/carboxylesterase
MSHAIVVQRPDQPEELMLLFHGVGADAGDLAPLGEALAPRRPRACIVSVQAPQPCDFAPGWQWFSVQGVDDASRAARVTQALPGFAEAVMHWQRETGVGPAASTIIGFSQGAIMALAATQQPPALCSRLVAIAGRFASPPQVAPAGTRVHLLHGDDDMVIPARHSVEAAAQLQALGAEVTLDQFPGLGHGIDARVLVAIERRLGG